MSVSFNSEIKKALKDIYKADSRLRRKAATHVKRKVIAKLKAAPQEGGKPGDPPGTDTGNLIKGMAVRGGAFTAYVGVAKPAYHAVILEFGGVAERVTKSGKSRGFMPARPFLFPTFVEEQNAVKAILSEERVK